MKRTCLVTVDAEALPRRATHNHVDGLLWGRFGCSTEYGVGKMVAEGDRCGVPITFFLDLAEEYLYGDDFRTVAAFLASSSHDLQIHLHPEVLPGAFWMDHALAKPGVVRFDYPRDVCFALMDIFVENFVALSGAKPTAYRAGAFQTNPHWLDAAAAHMPVSSNHCYSSWINQHRTPWTGPEDGPFAWPSGIIELPVTQVSVDGEWRALAMPFKPAKRHLADILSALPNDQDLPPVVVLLHSWSLLQYEPNSTRFSGGADWKVANFRRLLEIVSERFDPISTVEFARRAQSGQFPALAVRPYPEQDRSGQS